MLLGVDRSAEFGLFSVIVYGLSIIILFLTSTCYHAITSKKQKHYFRIADHISIYLLIAGTYTPILLMAIPNGLGWILFWVVWCIAAFGLILKLFFTGKFDRLSTTLYLAMGWLAVIPIYELTAVLDFNAIILLITGGIAYSVGVIFYALERIPYNHFIWHLFVLIGASCHFFMVYLYVI